MNTSQILSNTKTLIQYEERAKDDGELILTSISANYVANSERKAL